jgi:hypothetical protein
MSNIFNSAFNTIYRVRIICPSCKEKIHAHAKKCPFCLTDLTSIVYSKATKWQEKANSFLLFIVGLIVLLMVISAVNFFVSVILGLILYGLGYIIILKIQSIVNSMK